MSRRVSEVGELPPLRGSEPAAASSDVRPTTPAEPANNTELVDETVAAAAAAAGPGPAGPEPDAGTPAEAGPSGAPAAEGADPQEPTVSVEESERIGSMRTAQLASLAERADLRCASLPALPWRQDSLEVLPFHPSFIRVLYSDKPVFVGSLCFCPFFCNFVQGVFSLAQCYCSIS